LTRRLDDGDGTKVDGMTIRVKCPGCQQTLKATERHAGRTMRCPACRGSVTIPSLGARSDEETLDPFAEVAEEPALKQPAQPSTKPAKPKKTVAPKPQDVIEPALGPAISEDEVGEWLSAGGTPASPISTDEFIELPPQTPNWDGTTSTYDIAELGSDDPPPPKKRRKKT
jgi:ribosomal protein S27E